MSKLMKYSLKNSGTLDVDTDIVNQDVTSYTTLYDSISLKSRVSNIAGITAAFALMVPDCSAAELLKPQTPTVELVNRYINREVNDSYILALPKNKTSPKITFDKIVSDIMSFQSLKNDWDGYGAYALENLSGVNSIMLLEKLGSDLYGEIYDFYPNPNGTLSLEWKNNEKLLGLEIGNKEFSYFVRASNNEKNYYNHLTLENQNFTVLKANITKILK